MRTVTKSNRNSNSGDRNYISLLNVYLKVHNQQNWLKVIKNLKLLEHNDKIQTQVNCTISSTIVSGLTTPTGFNRTRLNEFNTITRIIKIY